MRFILRLFSLVFLVIAVIIGVNDAIQSVAAGRAVFTILGKAWLEVSPETFNLSQEAVRDHVHPFVWDQVIGWVLTQPACAVFLAFSLLFYLLAYRRRRLASRFAA